VLLRYVRLPMVGTKLCLAAFHRCLGKLCSCAVSMTETAGAGPVPQPAGSHAFNTCPAKLHISTRASAGQGSLASQGVC